MGLGKRSTLLSQTGSVNWAAITALAASITAVAALAVALMVARQMQQQAAHLEFNTSLESLWRLDADWNSDSMLSLRGVAADGLLGGHPSHELGEVMDFYRDMEFLIEHGTIDVPIIAHQFALPLQMYWYASADVRDELLKDDSGAHQDLEKLVTLLTGAESERRHSAAQVPSPEQIRKFLRAELDHSACGSEEEESDLRRTPL